MDWQTATKEEKLQLITSVVTTELDPMLARDGGGIDVIDLVDDAKVLISYRGACAGCPMAASGTLSFIQEVLAEKVHAGLVVVPTLRKG